jgi:hypothetical protein
MKRHVDNVAESNMFAIVATMYENPVDVERSELSA